MCVHFHELVSSIFQLAGATYMEVHAAGGGIHFTVDHVRRATVDALYADLKKYLRRYAHV